MYLMHHGIKGQKWGVRNGPPYPIEDKTLKKGTVLRSVSGRYLSGQEYKKSGRAIYTYNPSDEWDNKVYKGPFSYYLAVRRGCDFVAEYEFETVRDLKMPTSKERMNEFKDLYNDKKFKRKMIKELQGYQRALNLADNGSVEARKVDLKKLNTDSDYKAAYEIFNCAMEAHYKNKSTSEYMKRMQSKYDAMVDDNNQDIYNDAHDPIIIFKTEDLIERNGGTPISFLTAEDIETNTKDVYNELKKQGKKLSY